MLRALLRVCSGMALSEELCYDLCCKLFSKRRPLLRPLLQALLRVRSGIALSEELCCKLCFSLFWDCLAPCHLGWRTLGKCNKSNYACLPCATTARAACCSAILRHRSGPETVMAAEIDHQVLPRSFFECIERCCGRKMQHKRFVSRGCLVHTCAQCMCGPWSDDGVY